MEMLLKRIDRAANKIIDKNLTMDMTEQQITDLIYEEENFIKTT